MRQYMLDTNTVSHLLRQHPMVAKRVKAAPMAALCVSAITAGELLFGLALIAAHALGVGAVLVTNDQAFGQTPDLMIEDWTR